MFPLRLATLDSVLDSHCPLSTFGPKFRERTKINLPTFMPTILAEPSPRDGRMDGCILSLEPRFLKFPICFLVCIQKLQNLGERKIFFFLSSPFFAQAKKSPFSATDFPWQPAAFPLFYASAFFCSLSFCV